MIAKERRPSLTVTTSRRAATHVPLHGALAELRPLAAKTAGHCHLCHEPAPLEKYGTIGTHGYDAVTIDHLDPQSEGGDDHPSNLLLAHAICNSIRGTRDVEDVRIELAGTPSAPMSVGTKTVVSVGAGAAFGRAAGYAFGERQSDGSIAFNKPAAIITGLLAALVMHEAL